MFSRSRKLGPLDNLSHRLRQRAKALSGLRLHRDVASADLLQEAATAVEVLAQQRTEAQAGLADARREMLALHDAVRELRDAITEADQRCAGIARAIDPRVE